jgi:hypothetical protein
MRAFVNIKNNLAPLGEPQAFGFDEVSGFTWLGSCEATADEILDGKPKTESQLDKAKRLLEKALSNGAVLAVKIEQLAADNGISFKTFKRARELLGATAFRREGKWYWELTVEIVYEEYATEQETTTGQGSGQDRRTTALATISG